MTAIDLPENAVVAARRHGGRGNAKAPKPLAMLGFGDLRNDRDKANRLADATPSLRPLRWVQDVVNTNDRERRALTECIVYVSSVLEIDAGLLEALHLDPCGVRLGSGM